MYVCHVQVIKCWDAGTFVCLQTFPEHHTYRPDNCVTAMYWDAQSSTLIAAGNRYVLLLVLLLLLVVRRRIEYYFSTSITWACTAANLHKFQSNCVDI